MAVAMAGSLKAQRNWRLSAWRAVLALGVVAGAVLVAFPEIDLIVAHATFSPATGFVGWQLGWLGVVRSAFIVFYFGTIALAIVGWLASRKGHRSIVGAKQSMFMLLCLS